MNRFERIEVSGFKGLTSIDFAPGDINLITGRNNIGKTSMPRR